MIRSVLALVGATGIVAVAAFGRDMDVATLPPAPDIADVTVEQWAALGARQIFFGHQSVGENLIAGVEDVLRARTDIPIQVRLTDDPSEMAAPGLYHARIGQNGFPATKLEAFTEIVSDSLIASTGTVILKLCYLDIAPGVDPEAGFAQYRHTVDSLRTAHPGVTIVHVTTPLTTDVGWPRHVAAGLRGLTSQREGNYLRARYNELLQETYGGRDPVFDLARLEATDADGRVHTVRIHGTSVPILLDEWSSDGSHLNDAGRRRIAEAFLVTLAEL